MSEVRDPAIKLFGRNISLPEYQIPAKSVEEPDRQIPVVSKVMEKCPKAIQNEVEDPPAGKSANQDNPSDLDEAPIQENNCQAPIQENNAKANHEPEEDQCAESDMGGQEKALKRPDKILPCPRCNSLNTKFCYFNNYNVNQPRHFCQNCHRYWTAGGTMRNVPVGAGRRKNKHSSSQYRQVVVSSDGGTPNQADTLNSSSHQVPSSVGLSASPTSVDGIGEVQKFGTDTPLCESMETILNLNDQRRSVEMDSLVLGENVEEPSSSISSLSSSNYHENELPEGQIGLPEFYHSSTLTHPLQCYPGPPWAYPWNPGWNEMMLGPNSSNPNPVRWNSTPVVAVPGFCSTSITFPFVPASYWGCMPGWDARKWNVPFVGSTGCQSPSPSTSQNGCLANSSPTLGKHLRDSNSQVEEKAERSLWVPKTLRIDDPDEAAKSSIWATLGIEHNKNEPIIKGGTFKAFQPKTKSSVHTSETGQVLQANPAALSRSQTFQESI
ncbi:hypothetical protein L1049_011846 [Liquidambar formosana]|uniref:Dof-type domain-containing protein n=1 Tax=Liquidambar formosana TaxID=63359 RepID=A0AAP0WYD5_LIQFO